MTEVNIVKLIVKHRIELELMNVPLFEGCRRMSRYQSAKTNQGVQNVLIMYALADERRCIPFWPRNATATFQRTKTRALQKIQQRHASIVMAYTDNSYRTRDGRGSLTCLRDAEFKTWAEICDSAELQRFLGFENYYKDFILFDATFVKPMQKLLSEKHDSTGRKNSEKLSTQ